MNPKEARNPMDTTTKLSGGFRSFNLVARLKSPSASLDLLPLLDLLAVALLFSLLFSRLVVIPGVRLDLTETNLRIPASASAVAVLTVQNEGMLLFDGGVYQLDTITSAFQERVAQKKANSIILLLKAGERLPMASLLEISAKAKEAGFSQVHLAAKRSEFKKNKLQVNELETGNDYNFLAP
ncbi:MAG: Uncharacterised protein [Opitutia bacterium UBA7350]|nr:MAG: Uncharacterised protein [Opitutae bacterium UBA7350]